MKKLPEYYIEQTQNGKVRIRKKIEGTDNLTYSQVRKKVSAGSRFVMFRLSVFLFLYFHQHTSHIFFTDEKNKELVRKKRNLYLFFCGLIIIGVAVFYIYGVNVFNLLDFKNNFYFNAVVLLFSVLGVYFPVSAFVINLRGGEDITENVLKLYEIYQQVKKNKGDCGLSETKTK